jgi:ribosome-binding ATPase YchF (GTP1/OBG family)
MSRKQSDSLVRSIADAIQKDFYWVERELTLMIKDVMEEEIEEIKASIKEDKNDLDQLINQLGSIR